MQCAPREPSSAVWGWLGRVGVGAPSQETLTDKGSPVDVPRGVRPPPPGRPSEVAGGAYRWRASGGLSGLQVAGPLLVPRGRVVLGGRLSTPRCTTGVLPPSILISGSLGLSVLYWR